MAGSYKVGYNTAIGLERPSRNTDPLPPPQEHPISGSGIQKFVQTECRYTGLNSMSLHWLRFSKDF
jgi:hypothetical protein